MPCCRPRHYHVNLENVNFHIYSGGKCAPARILKNVNAEELTGNYHKIIIGWVFKKKKLVLEKLCHQNMGKNSAQNSIF